jgi:predicted lipoprotein with Yx(FWY)xxD motif
MVFLKRVFPLFVVLFLALALVACGNSTSTGSTSSSSSSSSSSTPGSSSNALVKTASATVQGKSVTLLTNAQGMTLYYFTADSATTSACTGSCTQTWPPLLMTGSGTPTSATSLPGTLSVQTTANGSQVTYNGHLLYTYSGDTAPGQTNGEGLFGKWFVATTDLSGGSSTPPSSGY